VLLRYNGISEFDVQVCIFAIWSFAMVEDKICVIENVGGVDEVCPNVEQNPFSIS
jgi:hypothetical protein